MRMTDQEKSKLVHAYIEIRQLAKVEREEGNKMLSAHLEGEAHGIRNTVEVLGITKADFMADVITEKASLKAKSM